jgi:hypothetical protein
MALAGCRALRGEHGEGHQPGFPERVALPRYVIAAFNKDLPYDQFLREQLAGDLLPAKNDKHRAEQLVATGQNFLEFFRFDELI